MYHFNNILQLIFPFFTLLILIIGLITSSKKYLLAALWLSLIATILHYRLANGEILGSYFDIRQATIYSINLIVLLVSLLTIIFVPSFRSAEKKILYLSGLLSAALVTGVFLVLANIWFNAFFLADRMPNTPILQVAVMQKPDYCDYKYVFYKVNLQGKISYMCPAHFGFLPSQGLLLKAPEYVIRQLPAPLQIQFKQDSLEKN